MRLLNWLALGMMVMVLSCSDFSNPTGQENNVLNENGMILSKIVTGVSFVDNLSYGEGYHNNQWWMLDTDVEEITGGYEVASFKFPTDTENRFKVKVTASVVYHDTATANYPIVYSWYVNSNLVTSGSGANFEYTKSVTGSPISDDNVEVKVYQNNILRASYSRIYKFILR